MTNVAFRSVADPPGLEILDRVSKRRFTLHTTEPPTLEPASTEPFLFPVEEARNVVVDGLRVPEFVSAAIRDRAGREVVAIDHETRERLPSGEYIIEITGRVKTYVRVDASLTVETGEGWAEVSFDRPTEVTVGARAFLRRPPTTVTTTRDLDDVRRAIETLSSSLQTLSPERSYPTLRGHPPRLELGTSLEIPDAATPPDTGITLHVPRELQALFRVASLVYYLGARISFSDRFGLETTGGFWFDFHEEDVENTLQHVFLLDCLVRTHGLYRQKHREYEALAPVLPLDMPTLYDATPADRLEAYLSVPATVTDPYVPRWPSVAYVDPAVERIEAIPHLVDGMSLIRTSGVDRHWGESARQFALSHFITPQKATRGASAVFDGRETFVDVPETAAANSVWVGDGIPINASKFVRAGYEHRAEREASDCQQLRVQVVCNDPSMVDEATAVESRYQLYDDNPVDVAVDEHVSVDDLARVLQADTDFFHFIGHATDDGLKCHDGYLDVSSLPGVGVDSFLLNACQSYRHGLGLVDRGAVGGIVTLSDVPNDTAIETGGQLAHLLNEGFTLQSALTVARRFSMVGGQYALVGDGETTLVRTSNDTRSLVEVESTTDGYLLREEMFLDEIYRLGSQSKWLSPEGWELHLSGYKEGPFRVTTDELLEYLGKFSAPVDIDGELHWSTELTIDDLES